MDSAFRFPCEGRLAVVMQQDASHRAIIKNGAYSDALTGDGGDFGSSSACFASAVPAAV